MILYGRINGGIEDIDATTANFEFKIPQYDPWGVPTGDYKYLTGVTNNRSLVSELFGKVDNFAKVYIQGPVALSNHSIIIKKMFVPKTFGFFTAK